ncbi:MAG: MarR family transcriptional regulator [Thermoplasmata archaeon]
MLKSAHVDSARSQELQAGAAALGELFSETMIFLHLAARRHGLTLPQLTLLRMLQVKGPLPPSQIADQFGISRPAVTSSLNILESAGWVVRSAPDTDRRSHRTSLTARSRRVLLGVESERRQFLEKGLAGIGDRQRADLARALAQLVANLRQIHGPVANPLRSAK